MEPISPELIGYRSYRGGWGFYFVNLLRALFDMYHQKSDNILLVSISNPETLQVINSPTYLIKWEILDSNNNSKFSLKFLI